MVGVYPLLTISVLSSAAPLTAGIGNLKSLGRRLIPLIFLFLITFVVEFVSYLLSLRQMSSYWLFHVYAPLEYALWMLVFSRWQSNGHLSALMKLSIPVFILISVFFSTVGGKFNEMNSVVISLASVVYTGVASLSLFGLQRDSKGPIYRYTRFWISFGLLASSVGSLAYFALNGIVFRYAIQEIWAVHLSINIFTNLIYAVGLLCRET